MGCGRSKLDETELVRLCRERRQFILSAVDDRYTLAAAHSTYIQSLASIGESVHRFVSEGFAPLEPSSSPFLTLPGDGKKESSKNGSESTSLSHSLSHRLTPGSHLNFNSDESDAESISPLHSPANVSHRRSSPVHEFPSWSPTTTVNYMKSNAIPSMVFVEQMPRFSPETVSWGDSSWGFSEPRNDRSIRSPPRNPPPPPSPPKASDWDFLNPFIAFENMYDYYSGNHNSNNSSPDLSEVRMKEGIPDLEDELQVEEVREMVKDKKIGVFARKEVGGDNGSESGHIIMDEDEEEDDKSGHIHQVWVEKEDAVPPADASRFKSTAVSADHQKGIGFGGEMALAEDGESMKVEGTPRTNNILEAVGEIQAQFMNASQSASEVSVILEVGKLPYRPKSTFVKAKAPQISLKLPRKSPSSITKPGEEFEMKSDMLSSILEEIYTWENKLYEEIKVEEKMRLTYEKNLKRLRDLDSKGAELEKVHATQATIRKQLMKISISMKAIDTMSEKLHRLRDYELQCHLIKLIEGMTRMWKVMLLSHQKQFQAMSEGKTLDIMWRSISRDAMMKAITQLEQGVLHWCSSFINWMNAQRAYVESLNNWLLRCIHQEPEVTADGVVPFSPSRGGAPPVFVFCNDWYQMMRGISVDQVIAAMHAFTSNVHKLWEQLDEEQRQSIKTEYLSKDLDKRHRLLQQEENKVQRNKGLSDKLAFAVAEDNGISLADRKMALDAMMKRLDDQRLKHVEAGREIHDRTLATLKMGLSQIFEAMRDLASSIIRGYEEIRIPNVGK